MEESNDLLIDDILKTAVNNGASDIHLSHGAPPIMRVAGTLQPLEGYPALSDDDLKSILGQIMVETKIELFFKEREIDDAYEMTSKERFRVNAYFERDHIAFAMRLIPPHIPELSELNLPSSYYEFCKIPQGLVLVAGPSGTGKSTTLASMLNWINKNRNAHIVTIEDPIEYMFESDKSLIHQRELRLDTMSWDRSLKSALREDADILLVGETRDYETLQLTLKAAETGHLVFTTIHAYSASQAVERIIGMFPENKQAQAKMQLSITLEAIFTQTLVKGIEPHSRYPAVEILIATDAVRHTIREGNTHFIDNIINTGLDLGMLSLERSLAELVNNKKVTLEEALANSRKPEEVMRFLKKR